MLHTFLYFIEFELYDVSQHVWTCLRVFGCFIGHVITSVSHYTFFETSKTWFIKKRKSTFGTLLSDIDRWFGGEKLHCYSIFIAFNMSGCQRDENNWLDEAIEMLRIFLLSCNCCSLRDGCSVRFYYHETVSHLPCCHFNPQSLSPSIWRVVT